MLTVFIEICVFLVDMWISCEHVNDKAQFLEYEFL